MKTMIMHCIDEHNITPAIEYTKNNYSHIRVYQLDEVIELWGSKSVKSFHNKSEKYNEALNILEELDRKYSYYRS